MKKHGLIGFLAITAASLVPLPASAALPVLRVTPLRYDAHLELGHTKEGVIDASNPTGSSMHVTFQVQAFRQINDKGELEFYDDERIASAIKPSLSEFDLGPREAVRTPFTIDPNKLGPGGAYGVIFLRTSDPNASPGQINTSARVGTLIILDVGNGGTRAGHISSFTAPVVKYGGHSLDAVFTYANTGSGAKALAYTPKLEASSGSVHRSLNGPFVFPGRSRSAQLSLPLGSHIGPVPVTLRDTTTGTSATRWVFMVTGIWTWLFPLLLLLLIIGLTPANWWRNNRRFSATSQVDGLRVRTVVRQRAVWPFLKRLLKIK